MQSFINSSSDDESESPVVTVTSRKDPRGSETGKLSALLSKNVPVYSSFNNNTDLQYSNFLYESDDESVFDHLNYKNSKEKVKTRNKSKLTVADLLKKDEDESKSFEHIINSKAYLKSEADELEYDPKPNSDENYWMEDSKHLIKINNECTLPKYKYNSPLEHSIRGKAPSDRALKIHKNQSIDAISLEDEDSRRPNINIPAINKEVKIELNINDSPEGSFAIPALVARYLKPYQVAGVQWLWNKYFSRQGCILADDMGLGKTIQIISFLLAIYHKSGMESIDVKANRIKRKLGLSKDEIACDNTTSNLCHTPNIRTLNDVTNINKITVTHTEKSPIHITTLINNNKSPSHSHINNNLSIISTPTPSLSSLPPSLSLSHSPYPTLIITPKSLLGNWESELKTWGYFLIHIITSKSYNTSSNSNNITRGTIEEIVKVAQENRTEIILCTYNTMIQNISQLKSIQWELVIFDEGHLMKSPKSQVYMAALQLSLAKCRCILSGTPIQNKLEELWSLLNIVTNGNIDSKSFFVSHYALPIKRAKSSKASEEDIVLGKSRQKDLRTKVWQKYVLQRFKEDVLSDVLQGKDDIIVFCELSPIQLRLYAHVLSLPDFDNARYMRTPCPCASNIARSECCTKRFKIPVKRNDSSLDEDEDESLESEIDPRAVIWRQMHPSNQPCEKCPSCVVLPCINKLLKIASHPSLLQVNEVSTSGTSNTSSSSSEFSSLQFFNEALSPELQTALGGPKKSSEFLETSRVDVSGKLKTLEKLLVSFTSKNEKTLLFSQSTQTLDIIESFVRSRGWRLLRLDGTTAQASRQSLVNQFNNDTNILVFLISTRAGGLGLNLVSARKVIIFDCSWNPSMDMQAQDRSYRFGQLRHVSVYRLVAQGTVEELCYMRQLYKQALQQTVHATTSVQTEHNFEGVEGDKSCRGELFGIENLLQLEVGGSILNKLRLKYHIETVTSESNVDVDIISKNNTTTSKSSKKSIDHELSIINAINRRDAVNLVSVAASEVKCLSYGNTITNNTSTETKNNDNEEEEVVVVLSKSSKLAVNPNDRVDSNNSIPHNKATDEAMSSTTLPLLLPLPLPLASDKIHHQVAVVPNNNSNDKVITLVTLDSVNDSIAIDHSDTPTNQPTSIKNTYGNTTSTTTSQSVNQVMKDLNSNTNCITSTQNKSTAISSSTPELGDFIDYTEHLLKASFNTTIASSSNTKNESSGVNTNEQALLNPPLPPTSNLDDITNSNNNNNYTNNSLLIPSMQVPPIIISKKRKLPNTIQTISSKKYSKQVAECSSNDHMTSVVKIYNPNYT